MNKKVVIDYYTFNFEKYNDDNNYIFQNIDFNKIASLDIVFSNKLD
jgi:hypothetical protein